VSWRRLFPLEPPVWWKGQLLAVLSVGVATDVRWLLQPLLTADFPFIAYFPAALIATIWGGALAGLTAVVLSAAVAIWLFLPTHFQLNLSLPVAVSAMLYVALGAALVALTSHLLTSSRREARLREQVEFISEELRHRIKNMLAVVEALSRQTARNVNSLEDFQAGFLPRLRALVATQDLLVQGNDGASLHTVVDTTLKPFDVVSRLERPLDGPDIRLTAAQTVALALVLNELATNAAKYGALSTPEGRLDIGWTRAPGGEVHMLWRERGGPEVSPPTRTGFGSKLFERGLGSPHSAVRLDYPPGGVICELMFHAHG
jgi:two-component sensor histidine kinase